MNKLRKLAEEAAEAAQVPSATFRVATFNILGASHSDGGNKARYDSGVVRARRAAAALQRVGVSVVGLQEYEPRQHAAFGNSSGWNVYPGMRLGKKGVRNSIAWDPTVWSEVTARHDMTPYFRGNLVPLPYVLLEHRETARRAWFISIHNPISSRKRGNNARWRDVATRKQAALMSRLRAETGYPVFLAGDFNERREAFCKVTAGGTAVAANGGSGGPPCRPPGNSKIDWLFATPDVTFSGYVRDASVIGHISDHALYHAVATLDGPLPDASEPQ